MQPERGGSRPRKEGARHGRRRHGGAEKAAEPLPAGSGADSHGRGAGGGRGRGGAHGHRGGGGGGGGRGRREPRGRRAAPPHTAPHLRRAEEAEDSDSQEEGEKEEQRSYSRRKVLSNWSRYEDTEREGEQEEPRRGAEFSVLLSSAGDFFAQFRFADEKEWAAESVCHKQFSALSVDCQSLAQALQELPLHLRLNVPAELVQASTPAELPQMKPKVTDDSKRRELLFRRPPAPSDTALGSRSSADSVASPEPGSKPSPGASAAEPLQRAHALAKQEADHVDEELDFLLSLDAPVDTAKGPVPGVVSGSSAEKELKDLSTEWKEKDLLKPAVPEEKNTEPQQQKKASKTITEEELEDWLDSMIS
ncbi:cell death regulator Aven [Melanerpes formicivorus]|uniref:cell death regulator Aven n=1 Tax=Melanerpes formicivorus TaxID=211600 RepID=UPI00358E3966